MEQDVFYPSVLTDALLYLIKRAKPKDGRDYQILALQLPDMVQYIDMLAHIRGDVTYNGYTNFSTRHAFYEIKGRNDICYLPFTYVLANEEYAVLAIHNNPIVVLYSTKQPSFGEMTVGELKPQNALAEDYPMYLMNSIRDAMTGDITRSQYHYKDYESGRSPFLMSNETVSKLTSLLNTIPTSVDNVKPTTTTKKNLYDIVGCSIFDTKFNDEDRVVACSKSYIKVCKSPKVGGNILKFDISEVCDGLKVYSYEALYSVYKALLRLADTEYISSVYLSDSVRKGLEYIIKHNDEFAIDPNMYAVDRFMMKAAAGNISTPTEIDLSKYVSYELD